MIWNLRTLLIAMIGLIKFIELSHYSSTKYQIFRKEGKLLLVIFSLAYEIRMGGWYKSRCISNHWDVRFCLSISSRTASMWHSIIISKGWGWLTSIIFNFFLHINIDLPDCRGMKVFIPYICPDQTGTTMTTAARRYVKS